MNGQTARRTPGTDGGVSVLVVDDSAVMRSIILKALRMTDIKVSRVFEAANGREGLSVLERNGVDVAFVDIHMPVMDGREMIARLREQQATALLPVIVISSECSQDRIAQLAARGVSFAHKPFTPESLRVVLAHALGWDDEPAA